MQHPVVLASDIDRQCDVCNNLNNYKEWIENNAKQTENVNIHKKGNIKYGVSKKDRITDSILKLVSLENKANSYARSLSGGMKRR